MLRKMKRFVTRKTVKASAALGLLAVTASNAMAENAMTTEAKTLLADLQTDVVALQTIMIGVVVTMAIAAIIYAIVKKK